MSDHSFIAPSSADKWVECEGAPHLCKEFPGEDSEDSRQGDEVHAMIAHCLSGNTMQQVGETAPVHGTIITTEMYESAMVFVREVTQTAAELDLTIADFHIEERIDCPGIHPTSHGSVDLWFHDNVNTDLYIYDYKNGHGLVEVLQNWQLLNYASGIVDKLKAEGVDHKQLNVWLCIIQPRGFHGDGPVRYWFAQPDDCLKAWDKLRSAAHLVYEPNPQCRPGPHCRYCSGRRGCKAANNAAMFGADMATDAEPQALTAHEVGVQLSLLERAEKAIEYRITGLREQARSHIKMGEIVTNYSVRPATGNLAWDQPLETCLALEAMTGIDIKQPLKLITPTQAANAGIDLTLIEHFASRPSRGLKLVASDIATAQRIFNQE